MKSFYYVLWLLALTSTGIAFGQPVVTVDGTAYTNGQTAYLDCSKSEVFIQIPQKYDGSTYYAMSLVTSSNFSSSNSTTTIVKKLYLDPNRQDGNIVVGWEGVPGYTATIYIKQRPPAPTFTATPILCSTGNSGTFSVSTGYNFQGTKPINIVWQTTGGITVNGSSTYTANSTTSSSITVQYNSFGTVQVYAVIPGCGNVQSDLISLYVGLPSSSNITFTRSGGSDPGSSLCSGSYYNFASVPELPLSQYNYSWSIPSGSSNVSYFYSYGPNANIGVGSAGGGFVLQMSVTQSGCSGTGGSSRTFFINNCSGFRVAQNPTSDNLTVLFDNEYDSQRLPDALQLAHEKSGIVKEKKIKGQYSDSAIKSGLSVDIDVHTLAKGTYYLRGIYGSEKPDKTEPIRVIIE